MLSWLAAIDFLLEILGSLLQGLFSAAECFDRVTEDTLGCLLDSLVKSLDTLACRFLGFLGFISEASIQQFPGRLECLLQPVMLRVAERIIELPREQWLCRLGPLDRVTHPLQQRLQNFLLLLDRLADLFAWPGISQSTRFLPVQFLEFLGNLLLSFLQLPGRLTQLLHFLFKLVGSLLPEIISQLLQFAFRPYPAGSCLWQLALFQCLGGLTDILSCLFKLLPGFLHLLPVLGF